MATLSSSSSSSSSNNLDRTMTNATTMGSNLNLARRVRVVAKIRGFSNQEAEFGKGVSWISVNKPQGVDSESFTVSFGDQSSSSRKDSYELDCCYEKNEGNDLIFSREVKPLISGVFDGSTNATVFAYGARNTGKTSVIQGSCENPGLAALAMAEILSESDKCGKSVSISVYEVYQDRVCDLLDPKQKAVFVLEDKQGKNQLKGLSRVPVTQISDFEKLYVGLNSNKPPQKTVMETRRSHRGLIVYISSSFNTLRTGKMNFVDLAGYEDVRRKSTNGHNFSEQNKTNTTVYAFLNVIHALSTNITHVPYRESKLARILQDSLGGSNKVLMITCLSPTFCQDSIYMIKLASRSCQKNSSVVLDSTKKIHSLTRPKMSINSHTPKIVCATTKKQVASRLQVPLSEKKVTGVVPFSVKGRKLFDDKSKSTPLNKNTSTETASSVVDSVSVVEPLVDEEDNVLTYAQEHIEPTFEVEKENLSSEFEHSQFTFALAKDGIEAGAEELKATTPGFAQKGQEIEMGNNDSPPISAKLKDVSNILKALISSTSFPLNITEKNETNGLVPVETMEPKTPMTGRIEVTVGTKSNYKNVNSPWETLNVQSAGMKGSIVQEYLKFLNTADRDELKKLRGIGEKRASYILELRDESPEPFKTVEDLKTIGIVGKKVNDLMRMNGPLFD